MKKSEKHQLPPGTLLDNRYLIQNVLGEGGFGITYEGINRRINVKVAIKEFYWKDYVIRNIEDSQEVRVISEDNIEMIEKAKEKFMKEARVIGDFIDESSIVDVTDYFEANNTAYIVMNYLDGITLKNYLKNKGPFAAEDIFRKMLPLMEGLGKVHKCGIIHRDISPDNIMMTLGGTLKLIDFGAARDYSAVRDKSYSVIVKGGYAPVEQYNSNSVQGPWTDIYALCSTLYECITNHMPDDALQRVFYDELKKPSEFNIKIDRELEKVLWKGLSVAPEERYQSMEEMLEDLHKILKNNTDEKKKSRWKLPAIISAALIGVCTMIIAGYTYADTHIASFKFRGVQTETVILSPDENMSAKEFREAKEIIENRLTELAGDNNFLLKEDENSNLTIITPLDIYHDWDITTTIKSFISRPARLFVYGNDTNIIEITPEDFINIEEKYGRADGIIPSEWDLPENEDYTYYELKLTDEKIDKLQNLMSDTNKITFYQDIDTFHSTNAFSITAYYQKDSDAFAFIAEDENLVDTLQYNLSHEKFSYAFGVQSQIPAQWENASQSIMAGTYQVNEESISDPALYIKYSPSSFSSNISKGQWYNVIADIKTRMDTLEIPYAFGIAHNNDYSFVIKINIENASFETLYILGKDYLQITDTWENYYPSIQNLSIETTDDGNFCLKASMYASEYSINQLKEGSQISLDKGTPELYLKIDSCKLFKYEFSDAVTETDILFTQLNRPENSQITENDRLFLNYVLSIANETKLPMSYFLDNYYATDNKGRIDTEYSLYHHSILELNEKNNVTMEIERLFPECEILEYYEPGNKNLDVTFNLELNNQSIVTFLDNIQEFFKNCYSDFTRYDYIRFFWSENSSQNMINIRIHKNTYDKRMQINGYFYGSRLEPYYSEIREYLINSEYFKSHTYDDIWTIGKDDFKYETEEGVKE